MATVYLHIGSPKTATSSLQAVFARHKRKLGSRGVLYPRECRHGDAHHILVADLIGKHQSGHLPDFWYGDFPRGKAWARLQTELEAKAGKFDKVVLSSELFFGQSVGLEAMLGDIRQALAGHTVKIVVYLRRQDQLYASFYNQDVKGARQWSRSAYEFYGTHQIFRHSYSRLMEFWSSAFGVENIIIRPYERAQWVGGDIVQDFCATIGIPALGSAPLESNQGLGVNQLYIKRCFNRTGFPKADNDTVVAFIQRLCPESPANNTVYVNRALYGRYRKQWQRDNNRLARIFLQQEQLFSEPLPAADELQLENVDRKVIAEFLAIVKHELRQLKSPELRQAAARAALLMHAELGLWPELGHDPVDLLSPHEGRSR
ncbi:hypothetical protein CWI75_14380 [Kineobactrum sediminis]|uniref:Sulfotransferase family protein n=1 Tax=Kineobactrum sediminis TaxID=1905677 RepID=A0A2N5XZS9_9GAMM|nr:hypothetical protein [Kineobactrum sediminis]PLW81651.1 hypothetical protein CWI75_14380 [Kineobactrum sediminis]